MTRASDLASLTAVTPPPGDNDTSIATTAFVQSNGLAAGGGYIDGLILSRSTVTTYAVAAGVAINDDASAKRPLALGSSLTKSLSAWAVGNNNGSLDTGAIGANAWYHVHLIRRDSDGVLDILLSLSATAPTMPSGWTARRRIGSIRTNASSQITPFVQVGDTFLWDVVVDDGAIVNPGTAAVNRTLTVPTGVVVFPIVTWGLTAAGTATFGLLVTPLSITDTAVSATAVTVRVQVASASGGTMSSVVSHVPTNTNAQVRTRTDSASASDTLRILTQGWIDLRGKA